MPDYSIYKDLLNSGKLKPAHKTEYDRFSRNNEELNQIINLTASYRVPSSSDKADAWESIQKKLVRDEIITTSLKSTKIIYFKYLSYASVAFFVLLIGLYFLFRYSYTETYKAFRGQTLTVILPDNSEVKLNSESVLRNKVFKWKKNRKVTFEGEAFFKVEKGGTFIVECGNKSITVLGTDFNVYSRQDRFEVQCFSGKIKVTENHSEKILTAGMATKSDKNDILCNPYFYRSSKAASWRTGEFYFDSVSLMNVFTEIERQFDVKIDVKEIDNRVYTGYFKNTNLKNTLYLVCLPM